jgi:hypothetical protein
MDVGVDTHDFRPWHFDEISEQMASKAEITHDREEGNSRSGVPDDSQNA